MDPKQYQDDDDVDTRTDLEREIDAQRERDEYLEAVEYDRQEELGIDAWRGLDHD